MQIVCFAKTHFHPLQFYASNYAVRFVVSIMKSILLYSKEHQPNAKKRTSCVNEPKDVVKVNQCLEGMFDVTLFSRNNEISETKV